MEAEVKGKIRNCIRAYVIGDALGVPFEFKKQGTFKCTDFTGNGTYNKPVGTWSDDTSVLLCWIDAIVSHKEDLFTAFKTNLKRWYYSGEFTVDGLFDIGNQTMSSIVNNFETELSDRMGNGALFHCLPTVLHSLVEKDTSDRFLKDQFPEFCKITHYNEDCFAFGTSFCLIIRNLLLNLQQQPLDICISRKENYADVISTYFTVLNSFNKNVDGVSSLKEDLCTIINKGNDTDTNAAFLGLLLGAKKPVALDDWLKVREHEYIDSYIDQLIEKM